jgi:hypothetical protein
VSAVEETGAERAERRWFTIAALVVVGLLAIQVVAGYVREATSDEPSYLEKVQICLTERATPFDLAVEDPIALSADRGALRTTVEGNGVTVALGSSENDAEGVYTAYSAVLPAEETQARLDRRRKVVFLWDAEPSQAQRDFMYLCTLDAQE